VTADLQPNSVLSDGTIRELIESGRIVIDPFDPSMIQPASVDIRLGNSFRVFHNHRIQSIDLVTRKLAANGGASVWALLDELAGIVKQVETSNDPAFGTTGAKLRDALGSLERASKWLLERVTSAPNDALAGATPYLRLFGSTLGGCMLAGEALAAKGNGEAGGDPQRYVTVARFFAENITVQAGSLEKTVTDSADAVNGADAVLLG